MNHILHIQALKIVLNIDNKKVKLKKYECFK